MEEQKKRNPEVGNGLCHTEEEKEYIFQWEPDSLPVVGIRDNTSSSQTLFYIVLCFN